MQIENFGDIMSNNPPILPPDSLWIFEFKVWTVREPLRDDSNFNFKIWSVHQGSSIIRLECLLSAMA